MSMLDRLRAAVSQRKADPEDVLVRCSFGEVVDVRGDGFRRCRRPADFDGRCWQHGETEGRQESAPLPLFGGDD